MLGSAQSTSLLAIPCSYPKAIDSALRRAAGQGNDVPLSEGWTYWDIFRRNAFTPLYFVLLAVGAMLTAAGLYIDALVSAGLIVSGGLEVDESILTGESELQPRGPGDHLRSGVIVAAGSCLLEVEKVPVEAPTRAPAAPGARRC